MLEYRSPFDAGDRAALMALAYSVKTVEPRQIIVRERELATHSCVLLGGFAVRTKLVATGHRQIAAIHIKGIHPRAIQIGDWRKLAEVGDFDSNYLHLHPDEPALN